MKCLPLDENECVQAILAEGFDYVLSPLMDRDDMRVVIVGIDHGIQSADAQRPEAEKASYKDLLMCLIREHDCEFIAEEANASSETVGQQLTNTLGLSYPWKNINMPDDDRKMAGIYEEQRERVPFPQCGAVQTRLTKEGYYRDLGNSTFDFTRRVPSDSVKEDYMFDQTMQGAQGAGSVMVLCGILHVEELAERFRQRGHTVKTDALHNYHWYRPTN